MGGGAQINLSQYYANNASGYTSGISGIPNSGTTILLSTFYNKFKTYSYISFTGNVTQTVKTDQIFYTFNFPNYSGKLKYIKMYVNKILWSLLVVLVDNTRSISWSLGWLDNTAYQLVTMDVSSLNINIIGNNNYTLQVTTLASYRTLSIGMDASNTNPYVEFIITG